MNKKNLQEELRAYIKKEIDKGFSPKKIKKALLDAGHPKELVEELIASTRPKVVEPIRPEIIEPKPSKPLVKYSILVLIAIILVIGSLFFLDILDMKKISVEEEPVAEALVYVLRDEGPDAELLDDDLTSHGVIDELLLSKDSSICDELEENAFKHNCKVMVQSITKNDKNVCDGIISDPGGGLRRVCRSTSSEDITLCEQDNNCRDYFYYNLALLEKNFPYCDNIEEEMVKQRCKNLLSE